MQGRKEGWCFGRLRSNGRARWERERRGVGLIVGKLMVGDRQGVAWCYGALKQTSVLHRGVVRRGEGAKKDNLLKQLAGKQDDLVYAAFNILIDNSRLVQSLNHRKSNALTNLCSVQAVSTELAFQKLVQAARLESTKSANAIKIIKGLGQKVANACQSDLRKALDILAQHAVLTRENYNQAIRNLTKQIVAQDNQSLCLCYFALKKACIVDDGVKLGSGRTKKDKLLRALVDRQCTMEYMAFWLLRNNSGYMFVKEQEQAKVIALGNESRNMALISFVNNQMISLDLAWRKLLGNAEVSSQASKNEKQITQHLLNRIDSSCDRLTKIAFSYLLQNNQSLKSSQTGIIKTLTATISHSNLQTLHRYYYQLTSLSILSPAIQIPNNPNPQLTNLSSTTNTLHKQMFSVIGRSCDGLMKIGFDKMRVVCGEVRRESKRAVEFVVGKLRGKDEKE